MLFSNRIYIGGGCFYVIFQETSGGKNMTEIREICKELKIDCDSPIIVYTTPQNKKTLKEKISAIADNDDGNPFMIFWGKEVKVPVESVSGSLNGESENK